MSYLARWVVFVDGDDAVDAARNAREVVLAGKNQLWCISDLSDDGESCVVDLAAEEIVDTTGGVAKSA